MESKILDTYQKGLLNESRRSDDDDEFQSDEDDFEELMELMDSPDAEAKYREERMAQLEQMMRESKYNKERAQLRTLTDESELFELTTKTAASRGLLKHGGGISGDNPGVVVHFFDANFATCKLMDERLTQLAERHFNTTHFVRIAAKDAPFLTARLQIQVLPCVIAYVNGVEKKRLLGFGELGNNPKKLELSVLEGVLKKAGAISRLTT